APPLDPAVPPLEPAVAPLDPAAPLPPGPAPPAEVAPDWPPPPPEVDELDGASLPHPINTDISARPLTRDFIVRDLDTARQKRGDRAKAVNRKTERTKLC